MRLAGPFEHSGSIATLEDWFDANRLRDDYVPTGWNPPDTKAHAIPGHRFGLNLSADDKGAPHRVPADVVTEVVAADS